MKRSLIILILILFILPARSQNKDDWRYKYWELYQQLLDAEDVEVVQNTRQIIDVLTPIYSGYDKKQYNDGTYEGLCLNLIGSYINIGEYKQANIILQNAKKRITNKLSLLRLEIKEANIAACNGVYEEAETILAKVKLELDDIIQSLGSQDSETISKINALVDYDSTSMLIKNHYIDLINNYSANHEWERVLGILQQQEHLFTSTLLTNEIRSSINDGLHTVGLDSFCLEDAVDARVFFYSTMGQCYINMGNYLQGDQYLHIAEQSEVSHDTTSVFCLACNYLGTARFLNRAGNDARAKQYYEKCMDICSQSGDDELKLIGCKALMDNVVLMANDGFIKEAQSYIDTLMKYYLQMDLTETIDFIRLLYSATQVASSAKDYNEVCELCKLSIPHAERVPNASSYTIFFYNTLANAFCELKQYQTAGNTLAPLLEKSYTANTYYTLAKIQYAQKQFSEAINSLKNCIATQPKNEPPANKLGAYLALLISAIEACQEIDISAIAESFLASFRDLSAITTSEDREQSIPIYQIYYGAFLDYCAHFNIDSNVAYNLTLSMKGAILFSDVDFKDRIYATRNNDLIGEYNHLNELVAMRAATTDPSKIKLLNEDIYRTEKGLMFELHAYEPEKRERLWTDVKKALPANGIAIEFVNYIVAEDSIEYAALVLRKDWDTPKMIPLFEAKQLEELKPRSQAIYTNNKATELIWGPLAEYISNGDNIYFSPSGALHHIAIESLPAADGQLMSERYNMYRLSTTKQLCYDRPAVEYDKAVLYGGLAYDLSDDVMIAESRAYSQDRDLYAMQGFEADSTCRAGWKSLPGTKKEVENISKTLKQKNINVAVFEGQAGNEESFRALSGQKNQIIHVATHGFFLPLQEAHKKAYFRSLNENIPIIDNSMRRSGLMLAGGNRAWRGEALPNGIEDGVLTAQEIESLDLRGADLVVLSACETGLGEVTGEGVFGLQRAFKKAGTQTLVMSLWKVNDAATELMMSEFYTNLIAGKSKREAFLTAQKAVRAKHPTEPYYWASFIMLD